MKRFPIALALALSLVLVSHKAASAEDVQYASYSSMQEMVDRIESLEATLASYNSGDELIIEGGKNYGLVGGTSCDSCGGDACSCGSCAIYGGAEIVFAKPHFEDEAEIDGSESRYDYEASARLIAGFRGASGAGARIRYWRWDHSSDEGNTPEDPFDLDVQALDLEATKMFSFGSIDAMLFGGARYGKVEHTDDDNAGMTFEGVGPTIGVDVMVPIRCSNFAILGGFRYSALFGHSTFTEFNRGEDDVVSGIDAQLGLQYTLCCRHGNLNLKALVESQVWEGATKDPTFDLDDQSSSDEDLGFIGFGFGLEYVY